MAYILLNEEPWGVENCPFSKCGEKCMLDDNNRCRCIVYYPNGTTFDFFNCCFCIAHKVSHDDTLC